MQTQSSVSEIDEQLSAYFDDELDEAVRAQFEAELDSNAELAAKLADLGFMRSMVVGSLEHQAERVPEARFEQLWDGFEHALERESRLQEAAETPPGLIQRLIAWARPVRVPLAGLAAVGALAFVIVRSVGAPSEAGAELEGQAGQPEIAANTQAEAASDAPLVEGRDEHGAQGAMVASEVQPKASGKRAGQSPQPDSSQAKSSPQVVAVAPEPEATPEPDVFPQPEPGEAEIRRIEFGGQMGTISQLESRRGTTTVIWVTEDEDPVDSERSL